MKRYAAVFMALAAAGFTAACNNANCSFTVEPGIIVTVVDSVTSQNITPGSSAVARLGFFVDSVNASPNATTISLANNRAGIYNLTVHHAGYRDWQRNGIPVVGSGCGIRESVSVTARMVK